MSRDAMIDASLFMGMHSRDEAIRGACKSFFAQHLSDRVVMSLEHVGRCDDLVWSYPRAMQDAYYPFMDNLHTDMGIRRVGYDEEDIRIAFDSPELNDLPTHERLLLGMVLRRDAVLYTVSPRLRDRSDLPVAVVSGEPEMYFPDRLERFYRESLVLRVAPKDL